MSKLDRSISESSGALLEHLGYHQPNPPFISNQPDCSEPPQAPQDHNVSVERGSTMFDLSAEPNQLPDSPIFSSSRPSHLPTPQSPNTVGQYIMRQSILDSPISHLQNTYGALSSQNAASNKTLEELRFHSPPHVNQILTPESSPNFARGTSPPRTISAPQFGTFPYAEETPRSGVTTTLDTGQGVSESATTEITTSPPLSSPFMAKVSLPDAKTKQSFNAQTPPSHGPVQVEDVFYSEPNPAISTPPLSPAGEPEFFQLPMGDNIQKTEPRQPDPKLIHQQIMDEMAHLQETELRRPDYLIRSPRFLSDENGDHPLSGVEVAVSPHKGRRLKLFQETSEESFEESLMAGGYGPYRTTGWLELPQPTSGGAGSSSIIHLGEAEEVLSPQEMKKRKRLAAFQDRPSTATSASRLSPVKMGSKGRILLDMSIEASGRVQQPSRSKKRASRRKNAMASTPVPDVEPLIRTRPNWPDTEFPWRMPLEERAEIAKAEEAERLRWIETFLDRDSEEDEDDEMEDDSLTWIPASDDRIVVPLAVDPAIRPFLRNDPADARVVLLSKRCVRALIYRQRRREARRRTDKDNSSDEVVCVCNGRHDGRELVQCDSCEIWYHLECIGIKNVADLGREEDPWYCNRCSRAEITRTPSPPSSEPTFVQEAEESTAGLPFDPPFFQSSPQDSPTMGSWNPHPSSTKPEGCSRLYASPEFFNYEDSPFDPTSTPSRGIKLRPPPSFASPKNNLWSARMNGWSQKPGRPFHGPGQVDSPMSLDGYRGMHGIEDSPVRRTKTSWSAKSTPQRFATSRTPSTSRSPSPPTGTRSWAQPSSTTDDWRGTEGNPPATVPADGGAMSEGKGEPVSVDIDPSLTRDRMVQVE